MASESPTDAQRAESIRCAVARDLHELGIGVAVLGAARRVVLEGNVATGERRERVAAIAEGLLPDFEIHNRIVVSAMAPPGREELS